MLHTSHNTKNYNFNKLKVFKQPIPKNLTNGDTDPHMISRVALERRLHNKWVIRFQVTTKKPNVDKVKLRLIGPII